MISIEKCNQILNLQTPAKYSSEEVIQIRDFLFSVIEIELNKIENNFNNNNNNQTSI